MKVVLHIATGRLVYRELPEPPDKLLLSNAQDELDYDKSQLVVIEVAAQEWDRELALREAERPVPVEVLIADLLERVTNLEKRIL